MTFLSERAEQEIVDKVVDVVFRALEVSIGQPEQPGRFLQTKQATKYCDVSKQTLQRWVEERGLPQAKVGGIILYDINDLDEFIAKYTI